VRSLDDFSEIETEIETFLRDRDAQKTHEKRLEHLPISECLGDTHLTDTRY